MENFSRWLNYESTLRLHPVRFAAVAHYKLVHIHPFTDGNGRTSRLLMNMILMQAGYPPVIIPKGERHKYLYFNLIDYKFYKLLSYCTVIFFKVFFKFPVLSVLDIIELWN